MDDRFKRWLLSIWLPRGFCREFGWKRWSVLRLLQYAFCAGAVIPMFLLIECSFEAADWAMRGDEEN